MLPLTLHTVVANAVKARAAGTLGFQRGHVRCRNRYDDGSCCVLGHSIPDELLDAHPSFVTSGLMTFVDNHLIKVADNELERMLMLQGEHDNACRGDGPHRDGAIVKFNVLLDKLKGELGL